MTDLDLRAIGEGLPFAETLDEMTTTSARSHASRAEVA